MTLTTQIHLSFEIIIYLLVYYYYLLVKTADLQAHNASHREALCACRSAVFTTFVWQPCLMKQGFTLRKNLKNVNLDDDIFI